MTESILVLTEATLAAVDAENIKAVFPDDESVELTLLVPATEQRNLFVEVVDKLTMLDLSAARQEITDRRDPQEVKNEAEKILQDSTPILESTGAQVTGKLLPGDVIEGLRAEVTAQNPLQLVVVTEPHAIEDTFHTDWASEAQRNLGIPVLHLYAGSNFIGDS